MNENVKRWQLTLLRGSKKRCSFQLIALEDPVGWSSFAEVYFVSPQTSTVITGLTVSLNKWKECIRIMNVGSRKHSELWYLNKKNLPVIALKIFAANNVNLQQLTGSKLDKLLAVKTYVDHVVSSLHGSDLTTQISCVEFIIFIHGNRLFLRSKPPTNKYWRGSSTK